MTVIGIETSSSVASLALCQDDRVVADWFIASDSVYAERLPAMLERTLAEARMDIGQVDGFALSIGPGSYTGLRIGLSLAKGLAYATGKPLAAVPTLDAVAYAAPYARFPVCALLDARRGQVYSALYRTDTGWPEQVTPFQVGPFEEAIRDITPPALFAGTGAETYRAGIKALWGDRAFFLPPGLSHLHAVPVAFLGLRALTRGEHAALYDLEPLYLRKPVFVRPDVAP